MGQAHSSHDHAGECFRFSKRPPIQSAPSFGPRMDAVSGLDASGVKLSWLVTQLVGSLSRGEEQSVQTVVEKFVLALPLGNCSAMEADALGPATHVVVVHPSTPWSAFIKALLNYVGMDPKKAVLAGDAPLSPRSPLTHFTVAGKAGQASGGGAGQYASGKYATDGDMWPYDGLAEASAECAYHSTFVHIDVLAHAPSSNVASSPPAAGAVSHDGCAVSGDAADRVVSRMGESAVVLLVIDPSGAIFNDPRAIRSVGAALATPSRPCQPRDSVPQYIPTEDFQLQQAAAATATNAGRPPRLQVASAVDGGDWAPLAAAFGRVPGMLPDDPAMAHTVCEALLEAARFQHAAHWPLLQLFHSRVSAYPEPEGGYSTALPPTAGAAGGGGGGGVGGGGASATPAERHLLPGQIETAERLAIARTDSYDDGCEAAGGGNTVGSGSRGHGPDSQSGMARFARDLLGSDAKPVTPPAVPPADAETLSLVRRSRSLTESAIIVCASGRQGLGSGRCSSSVMLPAAAGVGSGGAGGPPSVCPSASSAAGPCSLPPLLSPCNARGSCALSAASTRGAPTSVVRLAGSSTDMQQPAEAPSSVAVAAAAVSPVGASVAAGHGSTYGSLCTTAMASVASSTFCGVPEAANSLVTFAMEAARRYAALLEAVGLWAKASSVLEACVPAVGERWGHRSGRMAALLTQLGRLQQLQGLYQAAEVTWRQALEALERLHGQYGVPVLQCRIALAQVMAALQDPEAETLLRGALSQLDTSLGPHAPETLAAREALGGFLAQAGRWAEAEVLYQSLLQAMENALLQPQPATLRVATAGSAGAGEAEPQPGFGGGCGGNRTGALSLQQRCVSRVPSVQQPAVVVAGAAAGLARAEMQGGGNGGAASALPSSGPRLAQSDSRSRMAWGALPEAAGPAGGTAGAAGDNRTAVALPALYSPDAAARGASGASILYGASATYHRTVLPPLPSSGSFRSSAISQPLLPPLPLSGAGHRDSPVRIPTEDPPACTSPVLSPRHLGGGAAGGLGPGTADALTWSGTAAALAEVIAALQREYGGVNELYDGMHLAGPEGSTAADLAALAAVCPRSGACITAVVNVRRLTDADALYDAALAVRGTALDGAHLSLLALQQRYARHLSSAGEHVRAEAVCRAALEKLCMAPPPGLAQQRPDGGNAAAVTAAGGGRHPAELGLWQTLGAVLLAAGSSAAATAALSTAVDVAEHLVASGDLAAADMRRVEVLDSLSDVLWQLAQGGSAGGSVASALEPVCLSYMTRAAECKRKALDLMSAVYGERHERVMKGWVALGQMNEAAGDLGAAERAYEMAAEVALHRHNRLSAATKGIFRHLQRVYEAQGRIADAQVLGHMYRLKGGLLSSAPPPPPPQPTAAVSA